MKTKPQRHQAEIYEKTKDLVYHGYFLEQGLGKTKITLDVAFHLFREGKIDSVLVVAPNGVHLNWFHEELPKHGWHDYDAAIWRSTARIREQKALDYILAPSGRLRFLFANIEALRTKRGYAICEKFLKSGRCMMVVDESTIIKNIKAAQTKAALKLGFYARYRRILTGTPITQGPLDLFSQCKFLATDSIPIVSYTAFRRSFAVEQLQSMGNKMFNKVIGYKNLEYLKLLIKPFTTRLKKTDCVDLPEKIYQKQLIELTDYQNHLYQSIKETQVGLLEQEQQLTGRVSVTSVLTALVKLHQICCGFLIDDDQNIHDISNNRFDALRLLTSDESQKYVIWCVYKHSVRSVSRFLSHQYGESSCVSYFGETPNDQRPQNVRDFNSRDNVRFFIANRAASKGLTLTAASTAVYFTNSYSLEDRLQSEDRIHRIGQRKTCLYTDILTIGTVEEKIQRIIMAKKELSEQVITSDWKTILS